MYSLRVLLVALAGSAFVAAFPLQENTLQARDCPAGYQVCGVS